MHKTIYITVYIKTYIPLLAFPFFFGHCFIFLILQSKTPNCEAVKPQIHPKYITPPYLQHIKLCIRYFKQI